MSWHGHLNGTITYSICFTLIFKPLHNLEQFMTVFYFEGKVENKLIFNRGFYNKFSFIPATLIITVVYIL